MRAATLILAAVLIPLLDEPQQNARPLEDYILTEEAIAEAIEEGLEAKGGITALEMPSNVDFLDYTKPYEKRLFFSIEIYTPYRWISQQASLAAKRYKTFTRESVTEDMTASVLRVMAYPAMPERAPEFDRSATSGVDNVIIRSTAKENFKILRPSAIEEGRVSAYTLNGKEVPYKSQSAVFDLEQVAEIAKLDEKREFFIVVVGTKYNREFKIKTRHFDDLR